jgi:hypothetical protein
MGWGRVRSTVTVWLLATVMRLYRSHKVEDPRPPSTQVGSQNNLHKVTVSLVFVNGSPLTSRLGPRSRPNIK